MSASEILVKFKMPVVQTNCATKSLKLPHLDNSYYTESWFAGAKITFIEMSGLNRRFITTIEHMPDHLPE